MQKSITLLAFLFSIFTINAQQQPQTASVEKSIYGVQTGVLGIWVHNESKLSNSIALRTEVGLFTGLLFGVYDEFDFYLAPSISVDPRWYYNLKKRLEKGKSIANNSGNFVGIRFGYAPDWFLISDNDAINVVDQINILAHWGIKRTIGKHFTYEVGAGLGYHYEFNDFIAPEDRGEIGLGLLLRIGYTF